MNKWKKIKGFKNYQINKETLEVKSLPRNTGFGRMIKERILTPNKVTGKVALRSEYKIMHIKPEDILKI